MNEAEKFRDFRPMSAASTTSKFSTLHSETETDHNETMKK